MHLVSYGPKIGFKPFYHNSRSLTRPDTLPHIFRKLRVHRNLTKRALADKFGVSERYVSEVEGGSKFPSLKFCLKCANLFEANPGWVKSKWAKDAIERFSNRLMKKLDLDR